MRTTSVRAYQRKKPEKKTDPLQPMIDARRAVLAKRYGIALVQNTDDCINRPAEFVPGLRAMTLRQIADQLNGLAMLAAKIGRTS